MQEDISLHWIKSYMSIQKSFGRLPDGRRLDRIRQSNHYGENSFQNLSETPMMARDGSYLRLMRNYMSNGTERQPNGPIPALKTNLKTVSFDAPAIVWFGHSSYLLYIEGKTVLVDPVFSNRASPVQYFGVKRYETSYSYSPEDFPEIDALILTHDHYDHLDFGTIGKLGPKIKVVYTALGVGSHLSYWGLDENRIRELDWWESATIFPGVELTAAPARHFSGRGLTRNKTLWTSFVLNLSDAQVYLGGDSGYDDHFKAIGDRFGPFDIVILECGQYNPMWPFIHMTPEETVRASQDLKAKVLLPVHWGKFTLALHPWKEPVERALRQGALSGTKIATPQIGEPLVMGREMPQKHWWEDVL